MLTYKTKPHEVKAIQWNGANEKEVIKILKGKYYVSFDGDLIVITKAGDIKVRLNDYIVEETTGEIYAYSPELFEKNYEL